LNCHAELVEVYQPGQKIAREHSTIAGKLLKSIRERIDEQDCNKFLLAGIPRVNLCGNFIREGFN
jgi:hypothetical protein